MSVAPARWRSSFATAALAIALLARAVPAAAADSPAGATTPPAPGVWQDPDLWLGAAAAGAFALAASHDLEIADHVRDATPSRAADAAARGFRQLGQPLVVGAALAGTWGVARLAHAPALEHATARIALSAVPPGLVCLALKQAVRRSRPKDSPDDAWHFDRSFGDTSFPSAHTTTAFALAGALSRETRAPWVPWVAFPAAAACGWSRVHDREHWSSDVVAGAALGYWGGRLGDDWLRRRAAAGHPVWIGVVPAAGGAMLTLNGRF